MNDTAVNLGAGGFISYYENGGATVILDPSVDNNQAVFEEPEYDEQGVGSFLADEFMAMVSDAEGFPADEIRASGRSDRHDNRDVYYPEGQTFFETLATDYDYPVEELEDGSMGIAPLMGKNRMEVPRSDLPKAQELEDARSHMLASAMAASKYGPKTAMSIGNLNFEQLNVILGRKPEEQEAPVGKPKWRKNFRSPKEGPDVYFPREDSGYFVKDHKF